MLASWSSRIIEETCLMEPSDLSLLQKEDLQMDWLKPVPRRILLLIERMRQKEHSMRRQQDEADATAAAALIGKFQIAAVAAAAEAKRKGAVLSQTEQKFKGTTHERHVPLARPPHPPRFPTYHLTSHTAHGMSPLTHYNTL